jgi:carbon-monoxide dehydrogenase medium subunit
MKPARFDYERPARLDEASALLGRDGAKLLAGGQSLGPMLNLRLVQPALVIDVTGIAELRRAEETADGVTLGACVTHANIEDGRVPDPTGGRLPRLAHGVAYRAVRNRGTIGGSLAHADPAADWVSILAALGAEVLIFAPAGRRSLPVERFVTGVFETALEPGEILEAVRIPRLSPGARWGYWKFCRKTGEFASAIGAVLDDPARGICRAVIGATEAPPYVVTEARSLFDGASVAGRLDRAKLEPLLDEKGMTDPFERQIHIAALERAALAARSEAKA